MFRKSIEGLRHCYTKSVVLFTFAIVNTASDGLPHVYRSASTGGWFSLTLSINENQTQHVIFYGSHLLNNAETHRRQDKTCILAMLHFINITVWSRCCLETRGIQGILAAHIDGSAGAQFGTTFTILNSDFAHLKEMTQPLLLIHVCTGAFQQHCQHNFI